MFENIWAMQLAAAVHSYLMAQMTVGVSMWIFSPYCLTSSFFLWQGFLWSRSTARCELREAREVSEVSLKSSFVIYRACKYLYLILYLSSCKKNKSPFMPFYSMLLLVQFYGALNSKYL